MNPELLRREEFCLRHAPAVDASDAQVSVATLSGSSACAEAVSAKATGFSDGLASFSCSIPHQNECEVHYVCTECLLSNARGHLALELNVSSLHPVRWVQWQASIGWSARERADGSSRLKAVLLPSSLEQHEQAQTGNTRSDGSDAVRGRVQEPQQLLLSLMPTVYEDRLRGFLANGFRLQYGASSVSFAVTRTAESPISRCPLTLNPPIKLYPSTISIVLVLLLRFSQWSRVSHLASIRSPSHRFACSRPPMKPL